MVYTYDGILFGFKRKGNSDTWYNMIEPRRHAKLKWPET